MPDEIGNGVVHRELCDCVRDSTVSSVFFEWVLNDRQEGVTPSQRRLVERTAGVDRGKRYRCGVVGDKACSIDGNNHMLMIPIEPRRCTSSRAALSSQHPDSQGQFSVDDVPPKTYTVDAVLHFDVPLSKSPPAFANSHRFTLAFESRQNAS
jgi:hypothetical protein